MIGQSCRLLGTVLRGVCFGRREYVGDSPRWAIRYLDADGNPQEREFPDNAVCFDGESVITNVVEMRAVRAA